MYMRYESFSGLYVGQINRYFILGTLTIMTVDYISTFYGNFVNKNLGLWIFGEKNPKFSNNSAVY